MNLSWFSVVPRSMIKHGNGYIYVQFLETFSWSNGEHRNVLGFGVFSGLSQTETLLNPELDLKQ